MRTWRARRKLYAQHLSRSSGKARSLFSGTYAILFDKFAGRYYTWSGIFEIDRWEFIRHRARVLGVPPDYGNASLLERALLDYQEPGALDVEPSIVNRRIYASHEEMLNERTAVGTWQLDEPYHDEEVLIFRAFRFRRPS